MQTKVRRIDAASGIRTVIFTLSSVPLRPPIRMYRSSRHFRYQTPTNVQWSRVIENPNLPETRRDVDSGMNTNIFYRRGRSRLSTASRASADVLGEGFKMTTLAGPHD